jgi:1-aminocyclopropane-1-carboxylate deaminase/D-cysteine desulfhydrase-like pyridoxal-dependent ACC family enzyme
MRTFPLFNLFPEKQKNWTQLIEENTPVYKLDRLSKELGHSEIYIKREDLTDTISYGGNKVRNLEFLLGDALNKNTKSIVTLAPLGSNFVAALAAQSERVSLPVKIYHFVPHLNNQIEKHALYSSKRKGIKLKIHKGAFPLNFLKASANFGKKLLRSDKSIYRMPTGGSSELGAMGHLNAFLEMMDQVKRNEIPMPDALIVGAGTCGTMAGLLAGKVMTGSNIQIIGVRCVDQIVCNRYNIYHLLSQILVHFKKENPIRLKDIQLVENEFEAYGQEQADSKQLTELMLSTENIELDTTYTSKVFSYLVQFIKRTENKNRKILYWHTYSSIAMREC